MGITRLYNRTCTGTQRAQLEHHVDSTRPIHNAVKVAATWDTSLWSTVRIPLDACRARPSLRGLDGRKSAHSRGRGQWRRTRGGTRGARLRGPRTTEHWLPGIAWCPVREAHDGLNEAGDVWRTGRWTRKRDLALYIGIDVYIYTTPRMYSGFLIVAFYVDMKSFLNSWKFKKL